MKTDDLITGLPGETWVRQGLADLQSGQITVPACLVGIARPRLAQAGLLDNTPAPPPEPERELYRRLRAAGGDAYSRYNALLRELVSFENALDQRRSGSKRKAET